MRFQSLMLAKDEAEEQMWTMSSEQHRKINGLTNPVDGLKLTLRMRGSTVRPFVLCLIDTSVHNRQ
jgi:hypothetical protein